MKEMTFFWTENSTKLTWQGIEKKKKKPLNDPDSNSNKKPLWATSQSTEEANSAQMLNSRWIQLLDLTQSGQYQTV